MYGGFDDDDNGDDRYARFRNTSPGGSQQQAVKVRQYDTSSLQTDEAIAREKARAARDIEVGVREIAECQDELAKLINDQGVKLEEAHQNTDNAAVRTKQAIDELEKANKHARSTRKWKCCAVLIALIVIVVVIIIVAVMK